MAMKDTTPTDEFSALRAGDASTYTVGEQVMIWKYGNIYDGKVTAVGTRTVTVEFTPKNGRTRDHQFSSYGVAHLVRHRPDTSISTGLL